MSTPGFWKRNWEDNRVVITDSHAVVNRIWYLFPQGQGPRGAFATFETLKPHLRSRDVIYLSGVLEEVGAVTPDGIFDVTVIGAANRPRQATSGGVATGGGAYWVTDGRSLGPLLEVKSAGWMFQNICFKPAGTYSALKLTRSATVDLTDASHAIIDNCYFVGQGQGQTGIENSGGAGFCRVSNSRFLLLDAAIKCTSTAAAIPLMWEIENNSFAQNTNDIASSLSYGQILGNRFLTAGAGAVNKVISTTYNAVQGGNNQILLNFFNNSEAQIAPATGYTGAASDFWSNYVTDQAALAIGQPA